MGFTNLADIRVGQDDDIGRLTVVTRRAWQLGEDETDLQGRGFRCEVVLSVTNLSLGHWLAAPTGGALIH